MGVFHDLYNAPTEIYVRDLEDEVMELRAKVRALINDRDHWTSIATGRRNVADELRAQCHVLATENRELGVQVDSARRELNAVAEKARDLESKLELVERGRIFWQGEAKYWKEALMQRS